MKRGSGATFQPGRIKRVMQTDDDMGKVKKDSLVLMSRAIELFEGELMRAAWAVAQRDGTRRITMAHFQEVAATIPKFAFLAAVTGPPGSSACSSTDSG